MTVKYQNTLPKEEFILLLDHVVCDTRTCVGLMSRYILVFGILLGIRPSAMWELTLDKFKDDNLKV